MAMWERGKTRRGEERADVSRRQREDDEWLGELKGGGEWGTWGKTWWILE